MFMEQLGSAIEREYKMYHFYDQLKDRTNNPLFVRWITRAMDKSKEHYESFQQLYFLYTQRFLTVAYTPEEIVSFRAAILSSLEEELDSFTLYRNMFLHIPTKDAYAPMVVATTDKQANAVLLSTIVGMLK